MDGNELRHDVHRDAQVLHRSKTVADINCEGVIALKGMEVQISYRYTKNRPRASDSRGPFLSTSHIGVSERTINLKGCRHIEDVSPINVLLSEGVDVVEDRRACAVSQFDQVAEKRKSCNDEHHFHWKNIGLLHLKRQVDTVFIHNLTSKYYLTF